MVFGARNCTVVEGVLLNRVEEAEEWRETMGGGTARVFRRYNYRLHAPHL